MTNEQIKKDVRFGSIRIVTQPMVKDNNGNPQLGGHIIETYDECGNLEKSEFAPPAIRLIYEDKPSIFERLKSFKGNRGKNKIGETND